MKSHIGQVVLDNLVWEASAVFRLEASGAVSFYARNDHLGLTIWAFHVCRNPQLLEKGMDYIIRTRTGR